MSSRVYNPHVIREAIFDPTGRYRYFLRREWDPALPAVAFIMLNPSTADAERDDPTLRRCIGYVRRWGFGSLAAVNLFAYRTPDPRQLRQAEDPVGPENRRYLLALRNEGYPLTLAAWGNWGSLHGQDREVLKLLSGTPLHCIGRTKIGQPLHPLHQRGDLVPLPLPRSHTPPFPPLPNKTAPPRL